MTSDRPTASMQVAVLIAVLVIMAFWLAGTGGAP
jgi:hypothetical protein